MPVSELRIGLKFNYIKTEQIRIKII